MPSAVLLAPENIQRVVTQLRYNGARTRYLRGNVWETGHQFRMSGIVLADNKMAPILKQLVLVGRGGGREPGS